MNYQYELNKNQLELRVKKAPLFVRAVMFFFTILFFLLPLTGMILGLAMGKDMHFGYILGIFVFGILGFYMLRISLWNTYGKEIITFENNNITYIADYGWFKDGKKQYEYTQPLVYSLRQIGFEEDNNGGLVIELEEPITCVTKMPIAELQDLIDKLNDVDCWQ
jgi:hypothetical protein